MMQKHLSGQNSFRSVLILLTALFLLLVPVWGVAEEPSATLESDGSSYLGDVIAQMANATTERLSNSVYGLAIDREAGTAVLSYHAVEEAQVTLTLFNDYSDQNGADKVALYTFGPWTLDPQESEMTVVLPLAEGETLPAYFAAETETIGSDGVASVYHEFSYTQGMQRLQHATAADFAAGHYVAINNTDLVSDVQSRGSGAATEQITRGFVAYKADLVMLDSSAELFAEDGVDHGAILTGAPEIMDVLSSMSAEELSRVYGFVIRSDDSPEYDKVVLLDPTQPVTLDEKGLHLISREPEGIQEVYDAVNLNFSIQSPSAENYYVDTGSVYGRVSATPDFELGVKFDGWKANLSFHLGNMGDFDLQIRRATFTGDLPFSEIVGVEKRERLPINIKGKRYGFSYGLGLGITDADIYVAANGPADIKGSYSMIVYGSAGMSGLDYGYSNKGVEFTSVIPKEPNKDTYVYFGRNVGIGLDGLYFDFMLFEIGPVVEAAINLNVGGRAVACLEKDSQASQLGDDIIHECVQEGMAGCISGMAGSTTGLELEISLDLYFWDHTWQGPGRYWLTNEEEADHFRHSLAYGDKKHQIGKMPECEHELYRFSARVSEFGDPVPDVFVEVEDHGNIWSRYKTNEEGIAAPLYTYLRDEDVVCTAEVRGSEEYGVLTPEILREHGQVEITKLGDPVVHFDVTSDVYFPSEPGDIVMSGTNAHLYYDVECTLRNGETHDLGLWGYTEDGYMNLIWDDANNDPARPLVMEAGLHPFRMQIRTPRLKENGTFFRAPISRDVVVTINGVTSGNPDAQGNTFYIQSVIIPRDGLVECTGVFVVGGGYTMVTVEDGLNGIFNTPRFYRHNTVAIAVADSLGRIRTAAAKDATSFDSTYGVAWTQQELWDLSRAISRSGDNRYFTGWDVTEGDAVLIPYVSTLDGVGSHAVTFFSVGNQENITLRAVYGDPLPTVDAVDVLVEAPVPGEYLNDEKYLCGVISDDTPNVHGAGVPEEDGVRKTYLRWESDNGISSGRIRFNTVYKVLTDVVPDEGYDFRYPLGRADGTQAAVNGERADTFEAVGYADQIAGRVGAYFQTRKAKLLEVYQPNDLYYPIGTQPEVIDMFVGALSIAIRTEDPDINFTTGDWEKIAEADDQETIQRALSEGGTFQLMCLVDLPAGIEEPEDITMLVTKVVIHITDPDDLPPPEADPVPGIYHQDLNVILSVPTYGNVPDDIKIEYYVTDQNGEIVIPEGTTYAHPFPLYCAATETISYTVHAKSYCGEGDLRRESPEVTFRYILLPCDTEYLLTVISGSGATIYGETGSSGKMYVPFAAEVYIMPNVYEGMTFDHWEVLEGREEIEQQLDEDDNLLFDPADEFATFHMPRCNVTVQAVYLPDGDDYVVTQITQVMDNSFTVGNNLPQTSSRTEFVVSWRDENGSLQQATYHLTMPDVHRVHWTGGPDPIVHNVNYAFSQTYDTPTLSWTARDYRGEYFPEETEDRRVIFSPTVAVYVDTPTDDGRTDHVRVNATVSSDLKSATFIKDYIAPCSVYTVTYDANGGSLGPVPRQIIQVSEIPTELTDKQPIHSNEELHFLGWSTDPLAQQPSYVYDPENLVTFQEDITLYAVWSGVPVQGHLFWEDSNHPDLRGAVTVYLEESDDGELWLRSAVPAITVTTWTEDKTRGIGISDLRFEDVQDKQYRVRVEDVDENGNVNVGGNESTPYAVRYMAGGKDVELIAMRRISATKVWDIDLEGKDHPESVNLILQSWNHRRADGTLIDKLIGFMLFGDKPEFDNAITELEHLTGIDLKQFDRKKAAAKVSELISQGKLKPENFTDALKSLLQNDTNDSIIDGVTVWWAHGVKTVSEAENWQVTFDPVQRYCTLSTDVVDGVPVISWGLEAGYRVVEKSGNKPVEVLGTAAYDVPAYTDLAGREIKAHKTKYMPTYEMAGDTATVTNLAVEDHYLKKFWLMLNGAEEPEEVYVALLWRYDSDYVNAAGSLVELDNLDLWLPEFFPISGSMFSLNDLFEVLGIDIPLVDIILDKIKLPIAISRITASDDESKNWRANYRVRKYDVLGLPKEHEGAEFFSAICQDVIKYFLGVDIPIGINPLQGFLSVSAPEVDVPLSPDKLDAIANIKMAFDSAIGGTKVWEDENDADGIRPDSITLDILDSSGEVVRTIEVFRNDNLMTDEFGLWFWSCDDLDDDETYTVREHPVEGYTSTVDEMDIYNKHVPDKKTSVTVKKVWDDNDDQAGDRPDSVEITVKRNGAEWRTVTLNEGNTWQTTFADLPRADENGNDYTYSVVEKSVPEGYTASYSARAVSDGERWECVVTNKHSSHENKVFLTGTKFWDDGDDADGIRPSAVTIHLFGNAQEVAVFTVNGANGWTWSGWYPKTDDSGNTITYSIREDAVPEYTPTYVGLNVTNKHQPKVPTPTPGPEPTPPPPVPTTVPPSPPPTPDPTPTQVPPPPPPPPTETPVPTATPVPTVTPTPTATPIPTVTPTPTETPEPTPTPMPEWKAKVVITKEWDDDGDRNGKRPDEVKVYLYQNETIAYQTVLLTRSNGWTVTMDVPYLDADRYMYRYSVLEDVPDGYSASYHVERKSDSDARVDTWEIGVKNTLHQDPPPQGETVIVRKIWDDDESSHDRLLVYVYQDGTRNQTISLSEDNDWTMTLYYPGESSHTYSVSEAVPSGYTVAYDNQRDQDTGVWTCTITNRGPEPSDETVDLKIRKVWLDSVGNPETDRKQHDAITVAVYRTPEGTGVTEAVGSVVLGRTNGWYTELDRQPAKDSEGRRYAYSIQESTVPDYIVSYAADYDGTNKVWNLTVTNQAIPQPPMFGSMVVRKFWVDRLTRHEPITVRVTHVENGTTRVDREVELNEGNGWQATIDHLELKSSYDGSPLNYVAEEVTVPQNYTVSYNSSYSPVTYTWKCDITNKAKGEPDPTPTPTPPPSESVDVQIWKEWVDSGDADYRPQVRINLYRYTEASAVQEYVTQVMLTRYGSWYQSLHDLPARDGAGNWYYYTATEELLDSRHSYTPAYRISYDAVSNCWNIVVTNTQVHDDIPVTVLKVWDDDDDALGLRPSSVTVHLSATLHNPGEYVPVADIELSESNSWQWTDWLPEYVESSPYTKVAFRIVEDEVTHYTAAYSNTSAGLTVTNTVIRPDPDTVSVRVVKRWVGDSAAQRPSSLKVYLIRNGELTGQTVTLTADGGWTDTFEALPEKDDEGNHYRYTVVESPVPDGYIATYGYSYEAAVRETVATITNRLKQPDDIELSGRKIWDDGDDAMGKRASSVVFDLLANDRLVASKLLSGDNSWSWSGVYPAKDENNEDIVYRVVERPLTWYRPVMSADRLSVTNILDSLTLTNTVYGNDTDRDFTYTVSLQNEAGEAVNGSMTAELNGEPQTVTFTGGTLTVQLKNGDVFTLYGVRDGWRYTVRQDEVAGYLTWVVDEENELVNSNNKAVIDRDRYPEWTTAAKSVRHARADFFNDPGVKILGRKTIAGESPDPSLAGCFTFVLYDGHGTELARTVNAADGSFSFDLRISEMTDLNFTIAEEVSAALGDLYWYDISYHDVTVEPVSDGVDTLYRVTPEVTVINNLPNRTGLAGEKTWEDADDQDGIRPERIIVRVLADGEVKYSASVEPDEDGLWLYAFDGLPKYHSVTDRDLTEIVYTVSEETIPGYEAAITGYDILNVHIPETITVAGEKFWVDENDQDGIRPAQITVRLLADGVEKASVTVTPDEDGRWLYAFEDLPKYKAGMEIVYTVTEDPVEGYEGEVHGYDLTNTHVPAVITISGTKTWDDQNDLDGIRPASITIRLKVNGQQLESCEVTESDDGSWTYSFGEMPEFAAGRRIPYTITEDEVPGYSTTVRGFDVTNYHRSVVPNPYEFVFYKVWTGSGKHPVPQFTLYNSDGTVHRSGKGQQPKQDRNNLQRYTYWLSEEDDYYVVEEPMAGYFAGYTNIESSGHADVKDRVYNYGTITNSAVPQTGDTIDPALLLGLLGASVGCLGVIFFLKRKKR